MFHGFYTEFSVKKKQDHTRTMSESHFEANVFNNSITENEDSFVNMGD